MTGALGSVRVPASTSNLGPAFDCVGCALEIYLRVTVLPGSGSHRIEASGVDSAKMPAGDDNLILKVMGRVAERRERVLDPLRLVVENEVPLARGLGSSAAAILAGISCYEIATGDRLTAEEIIDCAWEFEPHTDNLASALFGGLTLSATGSSKPAFLRLAVAGGVAPVLVIPEFEVSTRAARQVLPDTYSRSDAVFNIQRTAQLVGALATGQWEFLAEAMRDRVHQPYRNALVPGLEQVLALREAGLYGIALSGAGPTVLALSEPSRSDHVGRRAADVFGTHGITASVRVSRIDAAGRSFGS
jgi:homoserine kinase